MRTFLNKCFLNKCRMSASIDLHSFPINRTFKIEEWNEVYIKYKTLPQLKLTSCGGLKKPVLKQGHLVRFTNSCIELVVVSMSGCFRLCWSNEPKTESGSERVYVSGMQALFQFENELAKIGVNLKDYAVVDGLKYKNEMPKPKIGLVKEGFKDVVFKNVNHIDMHSSHPAGIIEFEPKFAPVILDWYEKKESATTEADRLYYKDCLNHLWGAMQSIHCNYKYANISKFALEKTNERLKNMANLLAESGRRVISYNTDGIWFQGKSIPENWKSSEIGGWDEDYTNCKFRAKSDGCYEVEGYHKGKFGYFPKVRGRTKLDKVKPRTKWVWGDIYNENADVTDCYQFVEGIGIVLGEIYE